MTAIKAAMLLAFAYSAWAADATSARARKDHVLDADPASEWWSGAPAVVFESGRFGERVPGLRTEVRSRWTSRHLYFLFSCPFDKLNLKPGDAGAGETNELWNWDVAEIFIGSDFKNIRSYKEFEVSPRGEWVDLSIQLNPDGKNHQIDWQWNSGFTKKTRIDEARKIWFVEMRIPISALAAWKPKTGRAFRLNFYRIQGSPPQYLAWRPVQQEWFHNPSAFGRLVLGK